MYLPNWNKSDETGCALLVAFVIVVGGFFWLWNLVWSVLFA